MSRVRTIAGLASCVLALAACTSSVGGSATASPTSPPAASAAAPASAPASPSAAAMTSPSPAAASPSPAASSGATAVTTAIDPCQLVTSAEASKLAGTTFGPGKEQTTPTNLKECIYGAQTLNQVNVEVAQAPDVATIQAAKADAEAALQQLASKGLTVTKLPNLADGAAVLEGSFNQVNASAIDVIKGTVFFLISNLAVGHAAASSAALQAQAQVTLGRLP
jgi:hypothetical protein